MLLTDVVMPGMNGRLLAEKLGLRYPVMKVLYMSGYTDSFIAGHGVLEQGVQLLHKPFTEEALTRKVREVLDAGFATKRIDHAEGSEVSALAERDTSSNG
jgi:hypothetical protein